MKHLPTISESLNTIWETPKRKNIDGSVNRTKKAKIAQKSLVRGWQSNTLVQKFPTQKLN